MKKAIESAAAPKPIGPYSQAVACAEMVFVSGQIPADTSGSLVPGDIQAQTAQCLANAQAILEAAHLGLADIVKTTVYMTDLSQFSAMNEIYSRHFASPFPARSTVQVSALPKQAQIEIEVIAMRKS